MKYIQIADYVSCHTPGGRLQQRLQAVVRVTKQGNQERSVPFALKVRKKRTECGPNLAASEL